MDLGTLWRRWVDVLVTAYFAQREAWRSRRPLIVTCEKDRFVIRKAPADGDLMVEPGQPVRRDPRPVAVVRAGKRIPGAVSRLARTGFVVMELPGEDVVVRRIAIPVQAREFAGGIVSNQIERLSPWRADQAVYGFAADADAEDPATLAVRVLIAPRAVIDAARERLAAIGLSVDRIVVPSRGADGVKAVALWSRLVDVSSENQNRMRRQVGIGIAAVVAASLCLSVWATISAQFIRGESDDVAARIETLRRQMQGPVTLKSAASLPPNERAWFEKEMSPSAAIVLEALSRALPDTAYLTELDLHGTTLRIAGLTSDAPSLIAPLQHSGSFTDVRFFAPTTHGSDNAQFTFHIESVVEPQSRLADEKQ